MSVLTLNETIAVTGVSLAIALAASSLFDYLTTVKLEELHGEIYSKAVDVVIKECKEDIIKAVAARMYVSVQLVKECDIRDES